MNNIALALQITALGMGLVFAAIILLWWLMTLLTKFTTDASDSPEPVFHQEIDRLAQAAAVGVALAMAEQQLSSAHPLNDPPTAIVSAWQLGMRMRQMYQKGNHR